MALTPGLNSSGKGLEGRRYSRVGGMEQRCRLSERQGDELLHRSITRRVVIVRKEPMQTPSSINLRSRICYCDIKRSYSTKEDIGTKATWKITRLRIPRPRLV